MKNAQQQQAKNLYFQTNLNKSQIAETLGVNRRTVMLWVQQGNWDRLKLSSQHLPSMVVEKCYYMLNHYLDNLLSANSVISTFGPKEAAAINQLATGIKKISNRSAVNGSMELLSFFLEDVRRKDPSMAEAIMPFAEQYIATRKDVNLTDFLPQGFNEEGFLTENEDDICEQWLDRYEHEKMNGEHAEPEPAEPARDMRAEYEAWKIKKAEIDEVLRECFGDSIGRQSENAAGDPATEPSNASSPVANTSPRPSAHQPYTPNPLASIFSPKETLPKSVEKQLTDYLKKQTTQNFKAA